ncbi:MAG TPA: hypothetical protein VJ719_00535 [Chthoniobacterales bacterium]|nr:hypothetical protein [Chthoniobacterales bacterium]
MTMRIFIAGIIGGIVMFIWNFISHDMLPIGHVGVSRMANETQVIDALKTNLSNDYKALYFFPWIDPKASADAKKEAMEKIGTSPSGMLVYHPSRPLSFPRLILIELGKDVFVAILALFLLSSTRLLTAGSRILFVTIVGVIAAISTNISYWNWLGFPKSYTFAHVFMDTVGYLLVGIVGALVLRNRDPVAAAR